MFVRYLQHPDVALIGGQRSRAAYLIAERLGPPAISNARMATIRRDVATIDWIHVLTGSPLGAGHALLE